MKLGNIFARGTIRPGEPQNQTVVELLPGLGVYQPPSFRSARRWQFPGE
jgi:hypothetical protein